jgi:hyperosmotically inducible protein
MRYLAVCSLARIGALSVSVVLLPLAGMAAAQAPQTAPDNTETNVRDRGGETLTPLDQSDSEADRTLTQRIRQAVVEDDSLSTNAKNIKIITLNGKVTLRGPVNSEQEKAAIAAKAQQIGGAGKVENQLEIASD